MEPALSPEFGRLLWNALYFTLGHSLVVILLLAITVPVFSYFLFGATHTYKDKALCALKAFGWIFFLLPGVSWSLIYLKLQNELSFLPDGFWAICLVHFSMNFLLLTSIFTEELYDSLRGENLQRFEAALLLRLNLFSMFRALWWPNLKSFYKAWLPTVFLWCFSSFSVVLILSMNPRQSSPEILLFQNLLLGNEGPRVWVLVGLQLFIGLLVAFPAYISRASINSHSRLSANLEVPRFLLKQMGTFYIRATRLMSFLVFAILFVFIFILIKVTGFQLSTNEEILSAFFNSILLGLSCGLLSVLFSLILVNSRNSWRASFLLLTGFSPTLFAFFWLRSPLAQFKYQGVYSEIIIISAALVLVNSALFSRWISARLSLLSDDLRQAALVMGMNGRAFFWKIKVLFMKPILFRVFLFSFLLAYGDLNLTMLLSEDTSFLAPLARRAVQRYDFSLGSMVIWSSFFISALLFWGFSKLETQEVRRYE